MRKARYTVDRVIRQGERLYVVWDTEKQIEADNGALYLTRADALKVARWFNFGHRVA